MRTIAITSAVLFITIVQADAQTAPPVLVAGEAAARFQFEGAPVHPLCLSLPLDSSRSDPKSLAECTNRRIAPTAGRNGAWQAESDDEGVSYRVLANKGDRFLVAIDHWWRNGPPPNFTSLSWLALTGAQLKPVADLVVGDRCLGGLFESGVSGRSVTYAVNATSADVVALALKDQQREIPAGLSEGHGDCAGLLNYRYDLSTEQSTLESLSLNPQDPPASTPDRRLTSRDPQDCFAAVVSRYLREGKSTLPAAELPAFGRAFVQQCSAFAAKPQ